MRFYTEEPPKEYSEREVTFFTWFPLRIKYEIRWLEQVSVLQMYVMGDWRNRKFLN